MKHIILLRLSMPQKMLLYLFNPHLHFQVTFLWDRKQYALQIWNVLLQDEDGKGFPVQNLEEWRNKVVGDDDRDTFIENGFHDSWAVHFITFCTDTVLAALHVLDIVHCPLLSLRHSAIDFHVRIFVFPVLQQDWPYITVHAPCKECKDSPL